MELLMDGTSVTFGGFNRDRWETRSFFLGNPIIPVDANASRLVDPGQHTAPAWPGQEAGRRLSLEEIIEFGRQQTLQLLSELARLEADWDTYGSEPPTAAAIAAARDLIEEIHLKLRDTAGGRSLPFAMVPLSGGGVQIEWRGDNGSIEVEIGPQGELGYLLATGSGAERKFEEEDGVSKSRVVELVSALVA